MSKPLKKSKDVLKLAQRLRDELGIEIDTDHVYRIYAGHWQRSSGAWSWFAHRKLADRAVVIVGSQYPIRQIVRAWKLTASQTSSIADTDIDPVDRPEGENSRK
jgi:isopentenyldiphosphate isomerase